MGYRFEWDAGKAKLNLRKHGVSFEEATTVFGDPREMTLVDEPHSSPQEERFVSLGLSAMGRLIVVIYCE